MLKLNTKTQLFRVHCFSERVPAFATYLGLKLSKFCRYKQFEPHIFTCDHIWFLRRCKFTSLYSVTRSANQQIATVPIHVFRCKFCFLLRIHLRTKALLAGFIANIFTVIVLLSPESNLNQIRGAKIQVLRSYKLVQKRCIKLANVKTSKGVSKPFFFLIMSNIKQARV